MRVSIATLAFAAYLGLVSADTCAQKTDGYNPTAGILAISSPDTTHPVTAGSDTTITWSKLASTAKTVSIVLCKGPSSNCVDFTCITGSADNSAGSFTWKVPSTLPDSGSSGGYGLKIIENGTGKFQYSTQFGVINSGSGSSSAVQQISDGQVQAPTGTATVKATSSSAYNTKPVYTVSGAAASTGKPPVASTGLYYVPAPTGKTSNSTLPSGFKYTYAPNTAPEGALKFSTANIYSSGAVTATPSGPGAVTQTAIAGGGAVSGSAGGPAGSPSSTAPITAAIGAAPRMVAGGVLAGVGAIAALLL